MNLYLYTDVVCDEKHEIEKALRTLAAVDSDFCGENGDEYLWDIAKEKGFSSNLEYALSEAFSKGENSSETVEGFVDMMMLDNSYYTNYQLSVRSVGGMLYISVAYIC